MDRATAEKLTADALGFIEASSTDGLGASLYDAQQAMTDLTSQVRTVLAEIDGWLNKNPPPQGDAGKTLIDTIKHLKLTHQHAANSAKALRTLSQWVPARKTR